MREIEIKLRVPNLDVIAAKLTALGCVISEPIAQKDINFIHKDDVTWFKPTILGFVYPRLRIQEGKPLTFTIKKPLKNESDCIEHELHIDDIDELRGMMDLLGYKEGMTVEKTRRKCSYKDYTITLDHVEKLGSFIELERLVVDGDAEKIQAEMFDFAARTFGVDRKSLVLQGYDIQMHHLTASRS
jgi:adenylate cyclase class 2